MRYLVFAGSYYPDGGFYDYLGHTDTLGQAKMLLRSEGPFDWYHVVDIESFSIIFTQETDNYACLY